MFGGLAAPTLIRSGGPASGLSKHREELLLRHPGEKSVCPSLIGEVGIENQQRGRQSSDTMSPAQTYHL